MTSDMSRSTSPPIRPAAYSQQMYTDEPAEGMQISDNTSPQQPKTFLKRSRPRVTSQKLDWSHVRV